MVQGEGVSCNSSMEAELLTLYSNGIHANLWESGEYFISSIPSYPLYITLNPRQRPHYRFVHNLACEKALCLGKGGLISESKTCHTISFFGILNTGCHFGQEAFKRV